MLLIFGSPVAIIKHHDIAIRKHHTGVLLILPVEISFARRCKEIAAHHVFRPPFRISDDPVELSRLEVNIDNRVLVPAGQCQRVGSFVIPHRIVMEPVVFGPASGFRSFLRKYFFVIPGLDDFSASAVHQHAHIFRCGGIFLLSQNQEISILHLELVVVIAAGNAVLRVYFTDQVHFADSRRVVRHVQEPVGAYENAAVCRGLHIEDKRLHQMPAAVAAVVVAARQRIPRWCHEHELPIHVVTRRIDVIRLVRHIFNFFRCHGHVISSSVFQRDHNRIVILGIKPQHRENLFLCFWKCVGDIARSFLSLNGQCYRLFLLCIE